MKKHLIRTMALLFGITLLSSCMKNDPENNATVYYGYQQIPNINDYMPLSLLHVMDSLDCLHYGDEPPRIEGEYIVDSISSTVVILATGSNWSAVPTLHNGTRSFDFQEQHIGIAQLDYTYFDGDDIIEKSYSDSTAIIIKNNIELLLNDTLCPAYFHNSENDFDVFDHVYIIGRDSYFTIYYYDVRSYLQPSAYLFQSSKPLYANIISGKIETDPVTNITVIKEFTWGCQTVKYLNKAAIPTMVYNYHSFPKEGDGRIMVTNRDYIQKVVDEDEE